MPALDLSTLSYQQRQYIEFLGNYGRDIAADLLAEQPAAKRIISLYQMVTQRPADPAAWGLLMGAIDEWRSLHNART